MQASKDRGQEAIEIVWTGPLTDQVPVRLTREALLDVVRAAAKELFVVSFAALFLEMATIRWLNASLTVVAYFANIILISCFFGLGVGCLLAVLH